MNCREAYNNVELSVRGNFIVADRNVTYMSPASSTVEDCMKTVIVFAFVGQI
jgi:hypothetical protein